MAACFQDGAMDGCIALLFVEGELFGVLLSVAAAKIDLYEVET